MKLKKNGRIIYIYQPKKSRYGKEDKDSLQWHCKPIERDVAQLGSAFVLGTKCHGFKSCHPYPQLLPILWAVTRDQLRPIKSRHTYSIEIDGYSINIYMMRVLYI